MELKYESQRAQLSDFRNPESPKTRAMRSASDLTSTPKGNGEQRNTRYDEEDEQFRKRLEERRREREEKRRQREEELRKEEEEANRKAALRKQRLEKLFTSTESVS